MRVAIATPDSAPDVLALMHAAFGAFQTCYTAEAYAATVPSLDTIIGRFEEGPIWIASTDQRSVGTVSAVLASRGCYIRSMAVHPDVRRRGVGAALLRTVEAYAAERDVDRMYLSTAAFLPAATRLYERFGFVTTDDPPGHLFGTPLVSMAKERSRGSTAFEVQRSE